MATAANANVQDDPHNPLSPRPTRRSMPCSTWLAP